MQANVLGRSTVDDSVRDEPATVGDQGRYRPSTEPSTATAVPLTSLVIEGGPRLNGEEPEHTRLLAELDELPPILVHRPTMKVIDGVHRVRAALLRGDETIITEFYDGSDATAFIVAVECNILHGLPLTRADRKAAAVRIASSHPDWSDRAIARSTGLSARTVASLRQCSTADNPQSNSRLGQDGRIRPLNNARKRQQAARMIGDQPNAPLRKIADAAGISVSTAHRIRRQMRREGESIPEQRQATSHASDTTTHRSYTSLTTGDVRSVLQNLKNDPTIRLNGTGRNMFRWLSSHAIQADEWKQQLDSVPSHHLATIAMLARRVADSWNSFADELDQRRQVETPVSDLP